MTLDSYMSAKLVTGSGCVRGSAKELSKLGKVCLIVTGRHSAKVSGALEDVTQTLDANGQQWVLFDEIGQNPRLTDCMAAAQKAISAGADFVLGIGGGSALDAAKCIAVLAANPGMTQAQLYGFHWAKAPLKIVAVGTTAGTGSEVTKVSVITTPDGRKKSFHHEAIFPTLSLEFLTLNLTFDLLHTLFGCRQIFRHCAAKLAYGFAHLRTNFIMCSVCLGLSLHIVAAKFFLRLCCAEQICRQFSASHMIENVLALF